MIIYFSGGKDSLTVLHKYKNDPDLTGVFFSDTGHSYPHMKKFVVDTCAEFDVPLSIIKPDVDIDVYQDMYGLPSDIIPMTRSPEFRYFNKKNKQKIQSLLSCCYSMLWNPMTRAVLKSGDKTVFRGIKASDEHGTIGEDFIDDRGIHWVNPLWSWEDNDVFDYLESNNVKLADHYKETRAGFHCILCTAHTHSESDNERLAWTKKYYPEVWPRIKERFKKANLAIKEEIDTRMRALGDLI